MDDRTTQPAQGLAGDKPVGHILVVDDEEKNREILRDSLVAQGHRVTEAADGEAALQCMRADMPDTILLDIMMPKLNGFEVCKRIKSDPAFAAVPVVMVTALSEREERLKGIEAGATDYLVKPIDVRDMLLRVGNAVRGKQFHDQLVASHARLQELDQLREDLTNMIAHDMRTPLMSIGGYIDLLLGPSADPTGADRRRYLENAKRAAMQLGGMVNNMLDISRLESGRMPIEPAECRLSRLVDDTIQGLDLLTSDKSCTRSIQPESLTVLADPNLLSRVLLNLMTNALKVTPRGGTVELRAMTADDNVIVEVADRGPGIPLEARERIFTKFGQVEKSQRQNSSGLGLAFCKLAIETHSGRITVRDRNRGTGCVFCITLPRFGPIVPRKTPVPF